MSRDLKALSQASEAETSEPGHADPRTLAELRLSDRQLECLRWISEGKSSNDVGAILMISGRTVDAHVQKVCERLGVRTRMQAVAVAIDQGWIPAPSRPAL